MYYFLSVCVTPIEDKGTAVLEESVMWAARMDIDSAMNFCGFLDSVGFEIEKDINDAFTQVLHERSQETP